MSPRMKYSMTVAALSGTMITLFVSISDKVGHRPYYTYLDPASWDEWFRRVPFHIGVGLLVFVAVLLWNRRYYREETYKYCLHCKKALGDWEHENDTCTLCGMPVEELNGIFERHPELKED